MQIVNKTKNFSAILFKSYAPISVKPAGGGGGGGEAGHGVGI